MELIKILESLNTELPIKWEKKDNTNIGYFSLDDRDYQIEIVEYLLKDLGIEDNEFDKMIECAFKGKSFSEKDYNYSATKSQNVSYSAKIFGTVLNGITKRLFFTSESIIYFSAKKEDIAYESRKKLYNSLAKIISKKFKCNLIQNENTNCTLYILSKKSLEDKLEIVKKIISLI